ncbi:MAG: hypothetical protein RLZZ245_111, partial [Verrucomicrobiota bacterium]
MNQVISKFYQVFSEFNQVILE